MTNPADVVKSVYAAFGRGDLPAVVAACAEDVDWRCHAPSSVPFAGTFAGREGVNAFFGKLLASMRFSAFEPKTFLTDADTVVVLGRDTGSAIATGRAFGEDWVHVFTIRGAKIARFAEFTETRALEAAFARG